jgi:hypothetical protein
MTYDYIYRWGNTKSTIGRFRLHFKDCKCRIIAKGKLNSCAVEFENGEILNCSRNALKKVKVKTAF